MSFLELSAISIGLSMDAFSVSICKGLSVKKLKASHVLAVGIYFGLFQALMPLIGYFVGFRFEELIKNYDHWIAFILLLFIGGNMIRESFGSDNDAADDSFSFKTMVVLAIATSIDALAVGVSFAFLDVKIVPAVITIGITTFLFSAAGIKIGNIFGVRHKALAERAGGIILVIIGLKILLEHLGIIAF